MTAVSPTFNDISTQTYSLISFFWLMFWALSIDNDRQDAENELQKKNLLFLQKQANENERKAQLSRNAWALRL